MFILTTVFGYFSGILLLLFILVLVSIQTFLDNQKLFDPVIKWLCRIFPLLFGIRVKASGLEKITPGKTYIFMANHVNIFDGFLLYGYIPHFFRGVELEDHFSWPVWGTVVRKIGNIPISHSNPKAALESLDKASTAISKGTSIAILPEGHRTRDGQLQPFKRGPFRLAKKAEVDIVPIVMKGLWDRKSVHSKLVRPGKVKIIAGTPLSPESYKNLSDRELKEMVRNIILGMLE